MAKGILYVDQGTSDNAEDKASDYTNPVDGFGRRIHLLPTLGNSC